MFDVYQRQRPDTDPDMHVILTHEQRSKGRLKTCNENGEEVRIFLERGTPLRLGEILQTDCGRHVRVEGAVEDVMRAHCDDWLLFSRACYHLGNRHVKIQVGERWLCILPDHVLEHMLVGLGLQVARIQAVFDPETGAYGHGHHHH